ncbi:hypothetical protein AVEN_224756-1 [Araneus ventricosus]|uniref:Uncharacterized protein n=1 Tax=Araneus ventricosus TaxID=182803 RepID=A0A4Y2GW07_ARAVE|nr:hypothetical protein AVEN_224756-1 [Araneus ventricosus]
MDNGFVTNMDSSFPAMLVLRLGKEFYRGIYGNVRRMESSTSDLGDKPGDRLGNEMWDLKSTGIFLISPLRTPGTGFIQMITCDVTTCLGDYKRTVLGSQCRIVCVDRH